MALQIEYEEEALEDIVTAGRTAHERFGPAVANRFLDHVRVLVDRLATQPDMGRRCRFPTHPRLGVFQFFPLNDFPYLIFFNHDDETLRVYGVVFAAMNLSAIFRERWE